MDRRTLIAVVLIMAVLLVDQVIWSRWSKSRQRAVPPTAGGPAVPGDSATVRAALGDSALHGVPASQPAEGASSAARVGAPGATGVGPLLSARVAGAPVTVDSLATGQFRARFTSEGGAVSSWVLPGYRDPRTHAPVNLIPTGATAMHVAVGARGVSYDFTGAPFRQTGGSGREGWITYAAEDSSGVRVTKTYRLSKDEHLLDVEVRVAAPAALGPIHYQMGWANPLPLTELNARPLERTAVAYLGAKLETVDANRIAKDVTKRIAGNVRWAGERSKYFIATVIPDSATIPEVLFQQGPDKLPIVWLSGDAAPGAEIVRHARIYAGPIHFDTLVQIGAGLEEVANLGWKWIVPVSAVLLKMLIAIHHAIPNYGIAIILVALAAKLVFYPLTQSSLRTMKVMHRLQPEVNALREKHANDPAKMNTAMMNLYREHKVNPMGGCLPMLLQLPVFLALYQVLLHAIELRSAGFAWWIKDLSAPDVVGTLGGFPIHVLPLIMTGSTFLLQSQTPVDPRQQFMMYLMPVMMLYIMYNLPSGVIIYWTVNNLVSALQQYLVNVAEDRRMAAHT
ncbi:MAG TPA: membrane protein insertase YidC [Candidatus Binatia bacterium]|nr:membrane protein insertase YidC [Candidatus Binatia bacterium]